MDQGADEQLGIGVTKLCRNAVLKFLGLSRWIAEKSPMDCLKKTNMDIYIYIYLYLFIYIYIFFFWGGGEGFVQRNICC